MTCWSQKATHPPHSSMDLLEPNWEWSLAIRYTPKADLYSSCLDSSCWVQVESGHIINLDNEDRRRSKCRLVALIMRRSPALNWRMRTHGQTYSTHSTLSLNDNAESGAVCATFWISLRCWLLTMIIPTFSSTTIISQWSNILGLKRKSKISLAASFGANGCHHTQ